MATRTTGANFGSRCQSPESVTNAENETTQIAYRYDLGVPSSQTDPNGISIGWLYDNYGRKTRENRADGTFSTWEYTFCDSSNGYCGVSDLRSYVKRTNYTSTSGAIRWDYLYFDGFDRQRYDERLNLAGAIMYANVRQYDPLGRRYVDYVPVSTGGWHYHLYSYDLSSRLISDGLYLTGGTLDRQTSYAYSGRAVTITDPRGSVSTKHVNVLGQLGRVTDPSPGGQTNYAYEPFGNLSTVTDPAGNVTSWSYNLNGARTASSDVDRGSWTYASNSLGEVVSQTDAQPQTATFVYDKVGRAKSRTEAEGTSTWTWGTSAAAKNIGKLSAMSGPGYSESYTYDTLGRPLTTTYNADVTYAATYDYNSSTGFLDNITYPASTGTPLRAQYLYTNGILSQVRDYYSPSTVWWQLNAEDARGMPIDEQLANTVHILSNYDELTGHLNWRTSGTNAQYNNQQNITFQYDKNENLTDRIDVLQSNLTEHFVYDALNRLDYSTLNGSTNLDVTLDAIGNITYRSDVGNYTYHATRKHAVASTSNGWSFSYDNNGNMQTGRGATINWTSYNMPASVTNGGIWSNFYYTPNRGYWKQDAQYAGGPETTIYVGGLMEKVTGASGVDYHHMIRAGSALIVVSRSTGSNNNTYYVTQDSLGSSSVVTNSAGSVTVKQSFAAYGGRRGSNWTGTPTASDYTAIANSTRRGYTGHTELDNLGLVHMNGRAYDPAIGRFLSADPLVPYASSSQSYNRFSYVENGPLTQTDPSGFANDATKPYNSSWYGAFTGSFMTVYVPHGTTVTITDSTEINATPDLSNGIQFPPSIHISVEHGSFNAITGGGSRVIGSPSFEIVARGGRDRSGESQEGAKSPKDDKSDAKPGEQGKTQCSKSPVPGHFWSSAGRNWVDTNVSIPGILAPTGMGLLTAGKTSEAFHGTKAVTFGRWALSGFRPLPIYAAVHPVGESAIIVGATAVANFALTGVSFETGAAVGSLISAIPTDSGTLRDSIANGFYDLFGPESEADELRCGF